MPATEEEKTRAIKDIRSYISDARKLIREIDEAASSLRYLVEEHAKIINHIEDEVATLDTATEDVEI